ncbi:TonB family protein [Wolinella succinogenes]|uniref:energy transducer TonB n=1 Tax=Wolinella succinogenes TaxID=844 RepID=UPI002FCA35E5
MQRNFIALFISLLLHALLLWLLFYMPKPTPPKEPLKQGEQKEKKISLQNLKLTPPMPPAPAPAPQEPTPPSKEKELQENPKPPMKEPAPKPMPTPKPLPKATQERPAPSSAKSEPHPTQESNQSQAPSKPSAPTAYDLSKKFKDSDIKELYGEEFFGLGEEEQEFLEDNLRTIGAITQRYLKYPSIAGQLGQEGINAVEFYLHPNGDISDLRLIRSVGYTLLDKNSLKTIEVAYKDYPRPKTKTKIRIKVYYKIYGR